jgi:hypothetical protein
MQIHVNGEALFRSGTGASSALESLGVTVDGADIEIRDHTEPVFTDTAGPDMPFDEQQFGETAIIKGQMIFYDDVVLAKHRGRPANVLAAAEGTIGNMGALWGAGGLYFRLLVLSPTDSVPWNFLTARLLDAAPSKHGTRRTLWDLTWFAIPFKGAAGLTAGTVLYNRVIT